MKKEKTITKEVVFFLGRGIGCSCSDCPVLYGGECMTGKTPKQQIKVKKVKVKLTTF